MISTSKNFRLVKTAQALFYLNAVIWLVIGVVSLVRMANDSPDHRVTAAIVAVLMFGNAAAMLISGLGLGTRNKWLYFLAVAVIVVNIILTVTDQFGLLDFITLVIDVVLLGLLIVIRR
jgi:hypothetical protein